MINYLISHVILLNTVLKVRNRTVVWVQTIVYPHDHVADGELWLPAPAQHHENIIPHIASLVKSQI